MASLWTQLSLTFGIELMLESINIMMVGHLNDPIALAGVSLGHNIMIMLVLSTMLGMNTALETLVA
jgi:Na+-driven multidrug efflux pump